jgi:hypothetical protein
MRSAPSLITADLDITRRGVGLAITEIVGIDHEFYLIGVLIIQCWESPGHVVHLAECADEVASLGGL